MWSELAQCESRSMKDQQIGVESLFMPAMIPFLFPAFFERIGMDATNNDEATWLVSRSAKRCLPLMGAIADLEVCTLLKEYVEMNVSDGHPEVVMRVLISMQLLAASHSSGVVPFLQGMIRPVLALTEASVDTLAMGAYAVMQSLFSHAAENYASAEIYTLFCEAVQRTLVSTTFRDLMERALVVAGCFFVECKKARTIAYLAQNWEYLLQVLHKRSSNNVTHI
jgi:NAD-dependent oxidoreductase involved in siderophore biosynthesis